MYELPRIQLCLFLAPFSGSIFDPVFLPNFSIVTNSNKLLIFCTSLSIKKKKKTFAAIQASKPSDKQSNGKGLFPQPHIYWHFQDFSQGNQVMNINNMRELLWSPFSTKIWTRSTFYRLHQHPLQVANLRACVQRRLIFCRSKLLLDSKLWAIMPKKPWQEVIEFFIGQSEISWCCHLPSLSKELLLCD